MKRITSAALTRLAFVLALFGVLGTLHLSFAMAEASPPSQARMESGYGIGACGARDCEADYCAAPVESDMSGYAVPCETRGG